MEEGKSIKVLEMKACTMSGGDAGSLHDAIDESIILSIKENVVVSLKDGSDTYTINPMAVRESVRGEMNGEVE